MGSGGAQTSERGDAFSKRRPHGLWAVRMRFANRMHALCKGRAPGPRSQKRSDLFGNGLGGDAEMAIEVLGWR